jgi:ATP-dependent DNA helicase RecG
MLSFAELWDKLLAGDESVLIEVKRGERVGSSMLETISAYANEPGRGGGYLLLGVDRSPEALNLFPAEGPHPYEVVGVPYPDQAQADLATQCREIFNVPVRPQISVEQVNERSVLMVFIPEAQPHDKPVYIRSKGPEKRGFRRIGSTDQHLTDEDIALFLSAPHPPTVPSTRL